jgi:hypothetical protein
MALTKSQRPKTLTDHELHALRADAVAEHSVDLVAACDLALNGTIDLDANNGLSPQMRARLRTMTSELARAMCAEARAAEFRELGN